MRILSILLCFLCCGYSASAKKKVPVILVAGQSNADGRVPIADLPEELKTYKYCQWSYGSGDFETATGRFSLFSPRVAKPKIEASWGFDAVVYKRLEELWQKPFYVIKQTMGGTAIDTTCTKSTHGWYWSIDAGKKSLLKAFEQQIDKCLLTLSPQTLDIRCLIWHQGESDQPAADRYYDNLKAVITHLRQHLVEVTGEQRYASLPVICGTFAKGSRQGSKKVSAALYRLQSEDVNFHVVDASDLSLQNDQLHFDAKGAITLGERVFEKLTFRQASRP
ncbi:sialate O-acetylesterase [Prevotella communis]|uniref:sialate O-acetylesterase n=1 Tax=Prevotella communis TaxID=2913614 RepID=UPI001EDB819F|nr:sialate O-acetylesterase [Prevotella communis]UKK58895.1 sialate O-acetylesterase [Prevotella communis]